MGLRRHRVFAAVVVAAASFWGERAWAQAADPALAETLFREGKELMRKGEYKAGCTKFADSQKLDPKTGTLANLAACHERIGATATAWAEFTLVVQQAARQKQTEREQYAKERVAALEKQLARVTVILDAPASGIEVKLGERVVPPAAFGTPFPVDPGDYELLAKAPARRPWSSRVVIAPGPSSLVVHVPALEAAPRPPERPSSRNIVASRDGSTQRTAGWIALGAGAVGIGVGALFGVRTFDKRDEGDALCQGRLCSQEGLDRHEEAESAATISTIAFGVGAGAAVAGAVLLITAPKARTTALAPLVPTFGASNAGGSFSLRGSF